MLEKVKENRYRYMLAVFFLIIIAVGYFSLSSKKLYGNDEESIIEVIRSIEGYKNAPIEILEIRDFPNARVVGFLTNNNPAYIQFNQNTEGNYEWRHAEKKEGSSFASFLVHISNDEYAALKIMIVTTSKNEIAKLELTVNDQVINQDFTIHQKNVTWIDLPKSEQHTLRYKFFDKDGNIINGSH